jgi:uncharacterized protein (TIGR03382 family)
MQTSEVALHRKDCRLFWALVLGVATFALVSGNDSARACLPPSPRIAVLRVLPLESSVDLPLDTRGILHLETESSWSLGPQGIEKLVGSMAPALVDTNGVAVPATLRIVSATRTTTVFITPNEPLLPQTSYRLVSYICPGCPDFVADELVEMTSFVTGETAVGAAPGPLQHAAGSASIQMCRSDSCCGGPGGSYALSLRCSPPAPDQLVRIEKEVGGVFEPAVYSLRDSTQGQVYCTGNGSFTAQFSGFGAYRMALEGTSPTLGEWSETIDLTGDCSRVPRIESPPDSVEPGPELVEPNPEATDTQGQPSSSGGCDEGDCNAGGVGGLMPWLALLLITRARIRRTCS